MNREPVDEHLDSQEENEYFCEHTTCDGLQYVFDCAIGETIKFPCECDCHQKPEINIEGASWDNT